MSAIFISNCLSPPATLLDSSPTFFAAPTSTLILLNTMLSRTNAATNPLAAPTTPCLTAPPTPTSTGTSTARALARRKRRRPPKNYVVLIAEAILASPTRCLPIRDIYGSIAATYPAHYADPSDLGWQNTVRYNLSRNAAFIKVTAPATTRSRTLSTGNQSSDDTDNGKPATSKSTSQWSIDAPYLAQFELGEYDMDSLLPPTPRDVTRLSPVVAPASAPSDTPPHAPLSPPTSPIPHHAIPPPRPPQPQPTSVKLLRTSLYPQSAPVVAPEAMETRDPVTPPPEDYARRRRTVSDMSKMSLSFLMS